jgi:hypothetical protein
MNRMTRPYSSCGVQDYDPLTAWPNHKQLLVEESSFKTNSRLFSQDTSDLFWNLQVHYHFHRYLPLNTYGEPYKSISHPHTLFI